MMKPVIVYPYSVFVVSLLNTPAMPLVEDPQSPYDSYQPASTPGSTMTDE